MKYSWVKPPSQGDGNEVLDAALCFELSSLCSSVGLGDALCSLSSTPNCISPFWHQRTLRTWRLLQKPQGTPTRRPSHQRTKQYL